MKKRSIFFAPEAQTDLRWIYDVISDVSGPAVAARYVSRISDFCQRLELASERGTRRDDIRPGLRVIGFERRISIAFVAEAERVLILRLFYAGADWSNERL